MNFLDKIILDQLKDLEKVSQLRQEAKDKLAQKESQNSIEENIAKITREKDEYLLYTSLEKDIKGSRVPEPAHHDPTKWKHMNDQYKVMYKERFKNNTKCLTPYEYVLSQTILDLYQMIKK